MDNKYQIWKSKVGLGWVLLCPNGKIIREESFKDAVTRMDLCFLASQNYNTILANAYLKSKYGKIMSSNNG